MSGGHSPCSRCRHRLDEHVPTAEGWTCIHCECKHSHPPRPVKRNLNTMTKTTKYEQGMAHAVALHTAGAGIAVNDIRRMAVADPDYARGYDDAAQTLTGGHAKPILHRDEVTLHRETATQLVELLEGMQLLSMVMATTRAALGPVETEGVALAVTATNILPHLKLALAR